MVCFINYSNNIVLIKTRLCLYKNKIYIYMFPPSFISAFLIVLLYYPDLFYNINI